MRRPEAYLQIMYFLVRKISESIEELDKILAQIRKDYPDFYSEFFDLSESSLEGEDPETITVDVDFEIV